MRAHGGFPERRDRIRAQAAGDLRGAVTAIGRPPDELGRRLERILAATERVIREVPDAQMGHQPPPGQRTVRELAYHVFRLALAFPDAMDSGRLPERWVRESAPGDLRDGPAIARYGALVRGRVDGWFEGAASSEYDRTVEVWDGAVSGRELLERITSHAAHDLRQLHAALDNLGHRPNEPLPTADLQGLDIPASCW